MRNIEIKYNFPFSDFEVNAFAQFLSRMYNVDNIILSRECEDGTFNQVIRNEK